jgi:protein-S-isoprenylcysteine O-methyltransferase Ste14
MKQEEVIIGVILIAVGAILFFMGQSMDNSFLYSNPGPIMKLFGAVLLIVGFIVSIIGATEKDTQKKTVQQPRVRFCPACGRSIPFDARICPYCKKDFEQKVEVPK